MIEPVYDAVGMGVVDKWLFFTGFGAVPVL